MSAGGRPVALVSGANRGIGLEVVRGLAAAGFTTLLGARDPAAGEAARSRLDAPEGAVRVVALDVADPGSGAACVGAIEADLGRLDVLVNNAGVVLDAGVAASDPSFELAHQTLEVNLFGAWRLAVAAVGLLRASPDGRIVNVSSGMGQLSDMGGGSPGYRLSKAGINALTRMLAAELGAQVSVNAVCPGWVRTDLGGAAAPRSVQQGADTIVWAATAPREVVGSARFYRDRREIPW